MTPDPSSPALLDALLGAIETAILPKTEAGVRLGNKVFGAALLRKADLSVVVADTNNETENPLWHGEVHTLKRFHEMSAGEKPDPRELIFLSTHEPCSMCLSAITWAGFDNFFYFFSHEDSRDAFAIPHDLRILKEVFGLEPGGYRRSNAFWHSFALGDLIEQSPDRMALRDRAAAIRRTYDRLSAEYQASKEANSIPLA